jgi:hypothetical protein
VTTSPTPLAFTRTPPEAWERALWRLAPPSERLSWLAIGWIPYDIEDEHAARPALVPIERWAIYQMVPKRATPPLLWGPHQPVIFDRSLKRFLPDPRRPLSLLRENMTRWQWDLYQRTGQYGTLYWIVQGDAGGHRRRFDRVEQKVLQLHHCPVDPPEPGDLPYADVDGRVLAKLEPLERVRGWKQAIDWCDRHPDQLDADMQEAETAFRWQLWQWLESQVTQRVDEGRTQWRQWIDDAPRLVLDQAEIRRRAPDYEQSLEQFITDR